MSRDLRDPEKLGEEYLWQRGAGASIQKAANAYVPVYEDGGFISSNPAEHHSKVDQTLNYQEPADGVTE